MGDATVMGDRAAVSDIIHFTWEFGCLVLRRVLLDEENIPMYWGSCRLLSTVIIEGMDGSDTERCDELNYVEPNYQIKECR